MARERDGTKTHLNVVTPVSKTEANHLAELVELGIALSASQGREELNQKILMAARNFTNADGGSLYVVNQEESELHFRIMVNDTLETFFISGRETEKPFPPLPLYDDQGHPNHASIATYVALTGKAINIEDAYSADGFDFTGTRAFDAKTGYRSKSFLTVPLKNTSDAVIGVLQLIKAREDAGNVISFDPAIEPIRHEEVAVGIEYDVGHTENAGVDRRSAISRIRKHRIAADGVDETGAGVHAAQAKIVSVGNDDVPFAVHRDAEGIIQLGGRRGPGIAAESLGGAGHCRDDGESGGGFHPANPEIARVGDKKIPGPVDGDPVRR